MGVSKAEESPMFWMEHGQQDLVEAMRVQPNYNVAKNLIIFVGDGMGVSTIMAARVYKGQQEGRTGEDSQLSFEKFPYVALSKTYSVSHQVPDSAATATAMFTGVKTNTGTLGVSARTKNGQCDTMFGNEVTSLLSWAQEAGKDTGLVTTTRVTHATPAALYAHTAQRDWETDSKIPPNSTRCKDIAKQLVEDLPGRDLKVILGGGRKNFISKDAVDPLTNNTGTRLDTTDLIDYWLNEKANRNTRAKYVTNTDQLSSIRESSVDYLLGLFNYDHMDFELDRKKGPEGEPSISAMTKSAINMLQKSNKGYFLMVEGGRIDHAHHSTNAKRALSETVALSEAVQMALDLTSKKDTLIVVTADHSHVFTVNGYQKRGNPILGVADISDKDKMPYTTLMYTTGPGYKLVDGQRRNLSAYDPEADNFIQDTAVPMKEETHGGEDVPIYAQGPMAHLFRGVVEQNYIAHVMAYAACIGRNNEHCRRIGERLPLAAPGDGNRPEHATLFAVMIFTFAIHRLMHYLLRN